MSEPTLTKFKKAPPLKNLNLFEEFCMWSALPRIEKVRLGIETQQQFSALNKISEQTLTSWKDRPEFLDKLRAYVQKWGAIKTPNVVNAIYASALAGNSDSQRIWLQFIEKFDTKDGKDVGKGGAFEVTVNDIRALINILPEPLKSKHYGHLRELLDDASAVRNAQLVEDDRWTSRPEEPVSDDTYHAPQNISRGTAYEMASRHSGSVCEDMGWQTPPNYHQGTARGW